MQIITNEQAVLDLILAYWDNPSPMFFKETTEKIRVYWPRNLEYSYALDWEFVLTPDSLVHISSKYLHKEIKLTKEEHILLVDSTNFHMKIYFRDTLDKCHERMMSRLFLT